jgi:hypothetical protein
MGPSEPTAVQKTQGIIESGKLLKTLMIDAANRLVNIIAPDESRHYWFYAYSSQ